MEKSLNAVDPLSRLGTKKKDAPYTIKHKTATELIGNAPTPRDDRVSHAVADPAKKTEKRGSKFEVINVLLQILLRQEELTVEEYTINDCKFKVLVIEDTDL